jgi:hypothetical protein
VLQTRWYEPTTDEETKRLLAKARKTNASRDARERSYGFQAPPDGSHWTYLCTAICALLAGMGMHDWSCIAEGVAMLQDIESRVRPPDEGEPTA